MKEMTSEELKLKIDSKETFLLDMYATWCGPCKVMLSNLEMVSGSGKNNIPIYKYNVESDMEFSTKLGVRSVPTIKVFKDGIEEFSRPGVLSPDQILELVNGY
jgi:thioredoxin 1